MTATFEPNTALSPTEYETVERFGLDKPAGSPVKPQQPQTGTGGPTSGETLTAAEWASRKGIIVAMPNGWNTDNPNAAAADWGRQITETEFDRRAKASVTLPARGFGKPIVSVY
jgi:hypothetical protein